VIDHYDWAGGREAMLRFGPDTGPVVVAALPLFEEANRTRAFVTALLRVLAGFGIPSVLPELPGAGESLVPTSDASLSDWRRAFADCCAGLGRPVHVAAMRGGTLVDADAVAASRWHLVPVPGASVTRDLLRARLAAGLPAPAPGDDPVEAAGNLISRRMLAELEAAVPSEQGPRRVVREQGDTRPADAHLELPMLWRLPEPAPFPGYAREMAHDLHRWVRACAE